MNNQRPEFTDGDQIGKYVILRLLGKGKLATMYLAEQQFTKRKVALKFYVRRDEDFLAVVYRATGLLASMDHPYIIRLFDADQYEGWFYWVVEYVNGKTLLNMITAKDSVPTVVVLKLMVDVAEALEYAHQHGIIHGDIKPPNILVSDKGIPYLTDFLPLVVVEQKIYEEAVVGSSAYLSPETWSGKQEPRSDLWSLGMTFYHLLTGNLPFDDRNLSAIIQAISSEDPLDLTLLYNTIPQPVSRIIDQCLQKDLERRYKSATEFRRDCEAALAYFNLQQPEPANGYVMSLRPGTTMMLNV